jgi:signal transduction histidine kinase
MPVSLPPLLWLERANRLATLARLFSDVVHEVNNSLQVISGQAELLESMVATNDAAVKRARNVGTQARNASVLLEELQLFSGTAAGRPARVPLPQIARRAVGLRRHSLRQLHIDAAIDPPEAGDLFVSGSERVLLQIVLNMVFNAEEALAGRASGRMRLRTRQHEGAVELTVEDNGPGLPPDAQLGGQDAADVSNRLGIGREVSQWLARELGGRMTWAVSDEGVGCRATLSLPAAR